MLDLLDNIIQARGWEIRTCKATKSCELRSHSTLKHKHRKEDDRGLGVPSFTSSALSTHNYVRKANTHPTGAARQPR